MTDRRLFFTSFLILGYIILIYMLYWIFAPFLTSLMAAGMIALVFYPLYKRVLLECRGHENLAAFLMCFFLSLFVLLPLIILSMLIFQEVMVGAESLTSWANNISFDDILKHPTVSHYIERLKSFEAFKNINFRLQLVKLAENASTLLVALSTSFFLIFSNILILVLLIELNMFFLFRDGIRFIQYLKSLLPLSVEAKKMLSRRINEVIQTSILGTLATSGANGILGGLIFALLGLPSPMLWGVLMGILSAIPMIGTFVIWAPTAIYLILTGQILKGMILIAFCSVAMMGFADYMIRPLLFKRISSNETQLNTLVLFLSMMGGVQYYGVLGLVVGPLFMVVALTAFEMYSLYFNLPAMEDQGSQIDAALRPEGDDPARIAY